MSLPPYTETGDLPVGVHRASLEECIKRFGTLTPRRRLMGARLRNIHGIAVKVSFLRRFVVFGSFVSTKAHPDDVDIFMLMDDSFDVAALSGEARDLFDTDKAQALFGASVFWLRNMAATPDPDTAVQHWQIKRDRTRRGIVEIVGSPHDFK